MRKELQKFSYGIMLYGRNAYFYEPYCDHDSCGNSVIRWIKQASNWDGPKTRPDAFLARDLFISRLAQGTSFAA
jgi:hypothetical protein